MDLGSLIGLLIVTLIPMLIIIYLAKRVFDHCEKRLDVEAARTAEKAAQYATNNAAIEQRLRVLEQIVTDRGLETASQIEALRPRRLAGHEDPRRTDSPIPERTAHE